MSPSDQRIRAAVLDVLRHDSRLDLAQIDVEVVGGVVSLRGAVPTAAQRIAVVQDVERLKGVRAVVDHLTVTLAAPSPELELAQSLRARLAADHRLIRPAGIVVWVDDGVVTLQGSVRRCEERLAAAEDARALPGVSRVVNQLIVSPVAPRDDQETEADLVGALSRVPRLDLSTLAIRVQRGVVELDGKVREWLDVERIKDVVWCVPGVRNVIDRLEVEEASA